MKQISVAMPTVAKCTASECAYNLNKSCHAKAITVGDDDNPACDTYFLSDRHSKEIKRVAGVGACKVAICRYNEDLECTADSITVGHSPSDIKCMTFKER